MVLSYLHQGTPQNVENGKQKDIASLGYVDTFVHVQHPLKPVVALHLTYILLKSRRDICVGSFGN